MQGILRTFDIRNWDTLLIGDGSGSTAQRACGWAAVSIDRIGMTPFVWSGCMNRGTNNMAEMMAYLQPLNLVANAEATRRDKGHEARGRQIHVVTDSEYCRDMLNLNAASRVMTKNTLMWSAFASLRRLGIVVTAHHVHREKLEFNRLTDRISKLARRLIEDYNEFLSGDFPTVEAAPGPDEG